MMKAHARLWVDRKGRLCDEPPSSGFVVAAGPGDEVPQWMADRYRLSEEGGRVVQASKQTVAAKQADPPENKQAAEPENKGATFPPPKKRGRPRKSA